MDLQSRIAEIEQFLTFSQAEWPKLRAHELHLIARRCAKCIVSEKFSPLRDGVCELCHSAAPAKAAAEVDRRHDARALEEMLRQTLREYSGKGSGRYDALVLFSGGKDSAYMLQRLVTEHPALRLLALTVDNGFFSRVAMANAQKTIQVIAVVDHVVLRPKASLYESTFRHALTNLNEGGCYTTVDRMDGDLTFDIGRNFAASLDIPLVIAGLSRAQAERILGLKSFETDRAEERKKREQSAGFVLQDLYSHEELRYWWDGTAWPAARVPRVLFPFYAWPYDEQFIRQEVVRLGLIEAGQDNPLVTNNDTIPVMLAVDTMFLGYSGFEPEFAELVRAGKADRQVWLNVFEALEYLAARGRFLPRCVDDTLGRLGLTREQVGIPAEAN